MLNHGKNGNLSAYKCFWAPAEWVSYFKIVLAASSRWFFFIIMVLNLSVIIGSFAWKKVKSFMVLFVAVAETCVQYIRKVTSEAWSLLLCCWLCYLLVACSCTPSLADLLKEADPCVVLVVVIECDIQSYEVNLIGLQSEFSERAFVD